MEHVSGHVRYSGLTEEQIAKEVRWHPKRLRRILSGETQLRVVDLQALARALRKPVADLLTPPPGTRQRRAA